MLFFIPSQVVPDVDGFFADLDEPDEHFLLDPAMRVEASRPDQAG
jgi:hypothetical protein